VRCRWAKNVISRVALSILAILVRGLCTREIFVTQTIHESLQLMILEMVLHGSMVQSQVGDSSTPAAARER
jgi:hypothetical protein